LAGYATSSQNARSASRARLVDPRASAPATIAALIAPALVPLNCAIARLRLASTTSRTPHVYAPHDPAPCSANPTGLRIRADGWLSFMTRAAAFVASHKENRDTPLMFAIKCCDDV